MKTLYVLLYSYSNKRHFIKTLYNNTSILILAVLIVFFTTDTFLYSQNINLDDDSISDNPTFVKRVYSDLGVAAKTSLSDLKYMYTSPARINKKYALWLSGILAFGGMLYAYDQDIYEAIYKNKNHKFYKPIQDTGEFLEPLGYMGFTNKFIFGSLFIGYIFKNELIVNISADLLESFFIGSFGKSTTMLLVGREGPMIENGPRSFKFYEGRSFPSGHSTAIMQLASVLSHHIDYMPFKVAAYSGATTVLLQRMTSNHHWPSDVYTGAVYGWVVSHALLKLKKNRRVKLIPAALDGGNGTGLLITYKF